MKLYFNMIFCMVLITATACSRQSLFNHKNLLGWTAHGTEKWYVEKGELVSESGPDNEYGYLSTEKHYKNFVLSLDFKQEANGNSGVFIRSAIEGTKISGWQVEIAPAGLHTGGIYESYGRGWLIKPRSEDESILKPLEWNHMVIEAKGDEVTTWLNGYQMVYLRDQLIGKGDGFIALQIHSGGGIKVRFKNIQIKELK